MLSAAWTTLGRRARALWSALACRRVFQSFEDASIEQWRLALGCDCGCSEVFSAQDQLVRSSSWPTLLASICRGAHNGLEVASVRSLSLINVVSRFARGPTI